MDLLTFDHTLRSAGVEAALRELFIIVQELLKTVEELHQLQAPATAAEKKAEV